MAENKPERTTELENNTQQGSGYDDLDGDEA